MKVIESKGKDADSSDDELSSDAIRVSVLVGLNILHCPILFITNFFF